MSEGLAESVRRLAGEIEAALGAARAEEREACAVEAMTLSHDDGRCDGACGRVIAAAIRARGGA